MTYVDTSALVKRFVAEAGSPAVQALVTGPDRVATATIAYVELHAGLTRKRREGHLGERAYLGACRQFEQDWRAYVRVELTGDVLLLARDVLRRHALRGYDAVHLASALSLQRALGTALTFAAADQRLLRAASAERLQAFDVEAPTP